MPVNPANPAATQPAPATKKMRLRYKATCRCGEELTAGMQAIWNLDTQVMLCLICASAPQDAVPQTLSPVPGPGIVTVVTPDAEMLVGASPDPTKTTTTTPTTFVLRAAAICFCSTALPAGSEARWDSGHQAIRCLACVTPASPASAAATFRGITNLKLTRAAVCPCGAALAIGDRGGWHQQTKTMLCLPCAQNWAQPPNAADALPDPGVPGGSAQQEYERRLGAHRKKVRTAHPVLGRLLLRFGDEPTEITSWQVGAVGERRLAKKLSGLGDHALCLHDRRLPDSHANLDHVVIGQAGVYVIDAKLYADAAIDIRRADGRNKLATDQLRVSGRDGTKLIAAMSWQTAAVHAALDTAPEFQQLPVIPILCFIEGTFPKWVPAEGYVDIADVKVRGLVGATNLVLADGPYDLPARSRLLQHLARELPAK